MDIFGNEVELMIYGPDAKLFRLASRVGSLILVLLIAVEDAAPLTEGDFV